MTTVAPASPAAGPPPPCPCLSIGLTGHRSGNAAYAANQSAIAAALAEIFGLLEAAHPAAACAMRLNTLLAEGADLLAADLALARGWELVTPLPFGEALNLAVNGLPMTLADAEAILAGAAPGDPEVAARVGAIAAVAARARCFALAEQDAELAPLFLASLADPGAAAAPWSARMGERAALAARVMIEQADIMIGIWDGAARAEPGGTGHTVFAALQAGAPVVWIDVARPQAWRILHAPEALADRDTPAPEDRAAALQALARAATTLAATGGARRSGLGAEALAPAAWRRHGRRWPLYRRMEALFGGDGRPFRRLRQTYEHPSEVATGSGAALLAAARALPGGDPALASAIDSEVLQRFVWSDAISAELSDAYRGGMTLNFFLSAAAVTAGIAYQPFAHPIDKWGFALVELALLVLILVNTSLGRRRGLHARWFETRRVAEYLRHAPAMLLLGTARAPGRWARSSDADWPETYARQSLRRPGLPQVAVTGAYLRGVLGGVLAPHIRGQRDYHRGKAHRLEHVHHGLDRISEASFGLAILSVSLFLILSGLAAVTMVPEGWPEAAAKAFTFLGVLFPTVGAALAGIRYFGDFERFAAISRVAAEKLDSIDRRLTLLLGAEDDQLDYAGAVELAHAADDVVFTEIESWQAVFGGKYITIPA
ncbi:hypothetical protein IP88_01995 [alpha proteobacterium AAP81b]|nr:hypothetical protein IP88_01995 [alpha proteobacterium AAP81b]